MDSMDYSALLFNQFYYFSLLYSSHILIIFPMSVRLYVGNLSFDLTSDDLSEIFTQIGEVEDALIVSRPDGGRSRGFGFVTMADNTAGEEAIRQLNGQEVAGRDLVVNVAKERPKTKL